MKSVFDLLHRVNNKVQTAEEMIKSAGLDYVVAKRALYFKDKDGEYIEMPNDVTTLREDNDVPFGVVTKAYGTYQNTEAFDFTNILINENVAAYAYAGQVNSGATVFVIMKTADCLDLGSEDKIQCYFLLSTTHNGKGFLEASPAWYRPLTGDIISLPHVKAMRFRHSKNVSKRVKEAHDIIKKIHIYWKDTESTFPVVASLRVTDPEAREYFDALVDGDSTRAANIKDNMWSIYKGGVGSKLPSTSGTLLGCYLAAITFIDQHAIVRRSKHRDATSAMLLSKLTGDGARKKAEAYSMMLTLLKKLG